MKNGGSFNKDNPYDQKLLKDIQIEFGDKGQYYDVSFNNVDEYNQAIQILNSNNIYNICLILLSSYICVLYYIF